ncbi:MAG: hypothetical protein GX987_04655 [Tissierellia bacterium]|nr:hypothetical protein [Tissierellia bacterium]
MGERGFLLIEILMGLFLLGLITVTCLPILNTASNNLRLTKDKMDILFIAESTIEHIKSFDYSRTKEDEYLHGVRLTELIDILRDEDPAIIELPLNIGDNNFKYLCTIYKENDSENLWKIWVKVLPFEEGRRISNVEIMAFMPIPQEDESMEE